MPRRRCRLRPSPSPPSAARCGGRGPWLGTGVVTFCSPRGPLFGSLDGVARRRSVLINKPAVVVYFLLVFLLGSWAHAQRRGQHYVLVVPAADLRYEGRNRLGVNSFFALETRSARSDSDPGALPFPLEMRFWKKRGREVEFRGLPGARLWLKLRFADAADLERRWRQYAASPLRGDQLLASFFGSCRRVGFRCQYRSCVEQALSREVRLRYRRCGSSPACSFQGSRLSSDSARNRPDRLRHERNEPEPAPRSCPGGPLPAFGCCPRVGGSTARRLPCRCRHSVRSVQAHRSFHDLLV